MVAHSEILLSKCAQFRDECQFIDVRLKVHEDIFPAHRIVLAANSDYFHAMFTDGMKESSQEVIELKDESISPDALKIVMDSIYTGDLHVNEENVFEVLAAADHLQVSSVAKLCCDFMLSEFIQPDQFGLQTYCHVWDIADRHGLKDLQEAVEKKMASMFKDISESEEFLTDIDANHLFSLLSRDDLSAPSEMFIFKSVMQWIKHKKEERMAVAAKVIGAVRLGLVDIKVVIQELNTEEMQQDPKVRMLLQESLLHNNMPSPNSKFAVEKTKARSMSSVLVAINQYMKRPTEPVPDTDEGPGVEYKTVVKYFDTEAKVWNPLPSVAQLVTETQSCSSAEYFGNYLYVAGKNQSDQFVIYRYDLANNSWETLPPFLGSNHQINCLCAVDDYIYAISESNVPQRYSLANNNWQKGAKFPGPFSVRLTNVAAVVFKSKIHVIHGCEQKEQWRTEETLRVQWVHQPAVMHCFDPAKNKWEKKASTCRPHFGSSLFIVNNRLCVAGGKVSCDNFGKPKGNPAPAELYKEENNTWSVLKQNHIPPNNLCAVEIEGRVYFIINKFPIDSGIRIPPKEMYQINLDEWENLAQVSKKAVLCYLPVKRESLKQCTMEVKQTNN